jgi:hypothetical protein
MTSIHPRAACLQDLAREVRGKTIQLLHAAHPSELTWAPAGTSNHILWHAGHALWLADVLCIRPATGKRELPGGWAEMFRMGSRPASWKKEWPDKDDLLRALKVQLNRLVQVIAPLDGEQLDALPPFAHQGDTRSLGECILHGLHDEANHQGEMYLLLKMQRLVAAEE